MEQEGDRKNADSGTDPRPSGSGLGGGLGRFGLDSLQARRAQGDGPTLPTGQTTIRRQETGLVGVVLFDEVAEFLNRLEQGVTTEAHARA